MRTNVFHGSIVWWGGLDKTFIYQNVRRVQRQANIAITGALRETPSDALNVLPNLPPVDLLSLELAVNCAVRLRSNSVFLMPL